MGGLDLGITDSETEKAFEPYVTERFAPGDPTWEDLVEENTRRQRLRRLRRWLIGWIPRMRRTQVGIEGAYSRMWASRSLEVQLAVEGPTTSCLWRGVGMRARAIGTKRVHLLFLMRVIAQLRPASVLEVGCGNGLNLFILAGRFPEVRFTGVELTSGGVAAVQSVRALKELPETVRTFAPEPVADPSPFDRITVVHGSAAALPFPDSSFDLVFTSLGLEQMEEIRVKALAEVGRVARSHTAMVEPFREWNESGPQRDYIIANDYFAGRIADLPSFGLHPLFATVDMPCKLTFRPGLVVCRVR